MADSRRIHFVGIGGIGVSALAQILHSHGKEISGSDQETSALTEIMSQDGIQILVGHSAENLSKNTELVIHSLAIPDSNPELREARKLHIPILSYPQAVGKLTRQFYTIAISGTHGKSTVTAMITKVLIENGFDPNVIIGTKLSELGNNNFRVGSSKLLVLEACEYMRAFLNYHPRVSVIHTIDSDHLDYYKDFEDYKSAFLEFALKLPRDGHLIVNADDEDIHAIMQHMRKNKFPVYNTIMYGGEYVTADYNLKGDKIYKKNEPVGTLHLSVPGAHNRSNALAAFAVCSFMGIAKKNILKSLNSYGGAFRRFEIKGKIGKTVIIDDYAHHPTEIRATLQAAREKFSKGKICAVFQPHQYSRTRQLLPEFATCFDDADCVIVPNIYAARDSAYDKASVSPQKLVDVISANHKNAHYGDGFDNTLAILRRSASKFTAIITMGAGDVWKIAESLLKK